MFLPGCRHPRARRALTLRYRLTIYPPKREYQCSLCGVCWWEGYVPKAYLEELAATKQLLTIVSLKTQDLRPDDATVTGS